MATLANTATDITTHSAAAPAQATGPAEAPQPAPKRLRLGFLTRLEVGADAADSYRFALEMFALADELGDQFVYGVFGLKADQTHDLRISRHAFALPVKIDDFIFV